MERLRLHLQGHIDNNPCGTSLFEEHLNSFVAAEEVQQQQGLNLPANLNLEQTNNMSFLQMLKSVEKPSFTQSLLRLTQLGKQPWKTESQIQALEFESCLSSQDMLDEMHSHCQQQKQQQLQSDSCLDDLSNECNQGADDPISAGTLPTEFWANEHTSKGSKQKRTNASTERKKRKRSNPRSAKNKEDAEAQRMTHIAVERNRRRQMNEHLTALRALMPQSYVQRGDQASIVGGAINFVKDLEQMLQSLEAQKRMRMNGLVEKENVDRSSNSPVQMSSHSNVLPEQETNYKASAEGSCSGESERKQNGSGEGNDIQVTVIQNHVSLKIQCLRRPCQLLKIIVALEDFRLTVLHLSVTSLQSSVIYSFNLKIEEDCRLESSNEIAAAVHQIFNCSS